MESKKLFVILSTLVWIVGSIKIQSILNLNARGFLIMMIVSIILQVIMLNTGWNIIEKYESNR